MRGTACWLVWIGVGWALLGAAGCGEETPVCGEGYDGVPVIIPDSTQLETFWVGAVGVDELEVVGFGASHDTLVQANFNDFTDYRVQLAPTIAFSEACFVYTGQPVVTGSAEPLQIERVVFRGLAGGEQTLTPDEFRHIEGVLLPERGFAEPAIEIELFSGAGAEDFPPFAESIAAPEAPVLESLDGQPGDGLATGALALGVAVERVAPLRVCWTPAAGDYVEVKILPGAGSGTPYGKLRCITFDDGCLEIPGAALGQLALDSATNFRFRLERHNFLLHSEQAGGVTRAATLIDVSSSVEGVVLR
ncbi:MAG TPA: hypothetical protein PK668_19120 [Myxococcota bacterium]|nr:hypothetical protein [Myxococcota bacterium]HRY95157.1 hypothetical protein [Myxococcota bacterium]